MDYANVRKVGIIGAGVAGIATAKMLLAQGLDCTLFERGPTLGGVWSDGYLNFGVQVQRELYEFPDRPLPLDIPDFTPGPVIQKYLEDYAVEFGVWPHIRFNAPVVGLRQGRGGEGGWIIACDQGGVPREATFDLVVVCIGLYSNKPHMPGFPGQDRFAGEIIHISDLKSANQLAGRKVAVVGFGKSATDAALESAAVAAETTIIFRQPHWPIPQKLAGVLPFKWGMLSRLTSTLIPLHYRPSAAERVMHSLGKPLAWLWWRLVELLLTIQCGLDSRFGTRVSLVPASPVEIDSFGESTMLPRPAFYRHVRNGAISPRRTVIARYTQRGLILENGDELDADVVVLATGWQTDYTFLDAAARSAIGFEDDGFYLYRQMLHPDLPGLVFVGAASTIVSILSYSLQARWLAELLKGRHRLPSPEDMRRDIDDMKAWKREWMPHSGSRGSRLLLHMLHYHDQLLTDFGADPHRKTGFFAPVKEVFAPYEPNDYDTIISGQWETE